MKRLKIKQNIEETLDGSIGALLINNEVLCWTLTPDSFDEKYHLSLGKYEYKRFRGTKFKDTFEIIVPGHTEVLFHNGNTEENTKGCVLLGMKTGEIGGKRAVLDSIDAFDKFMRIMGVTQEGILEVI